MLKKVAAAALGVVVLFSLGACNKGTDNTANPSAVPTTTTTDTTTQQQQTPAAPAPAAPAGGTTETTSPATGGTT